MDASIAMDSSGSAPDEVLHVQEAFDKEKQNSVTVNSSIEEVSFCPQPPSAQESEWTRRSRRAVGTGRLLRKGLSYRFVLSKWPTRHFLHSVNIAAAIPQLLNREQKSLPRIAGTGRGTGKQTERFHTAVQEAIFKESPVNRAKKIPSR